MLQQGATLAQKMQFFRDAVTLYPVSSEPLAAGRSDLEWLESWTGGVSGSMPNPYSCLGISGFSGMYGLTTSVTGGGGGSETGSITGGTLGAFRVSAASSSSSLSMT